MALLRIESENENLSFCIAKNPASGLQMKPLRQGTVCGWFHQGAYLLYFKDSPDELSFKDSPDAEYEYLSTEKYIAPVVYISMINMMLSSALKTQHAMDVECKHTVKLMVRIEFDRYIKFFNDAYGDKAFISFDEQVKSVGILTVEYNSTMFYALNHLMSLMMFMALISDNRDMSFNQIDDNQIEKYLKSLKILGDAYFPMYMFKKNMIRSPKKFAELWKPILDTDEMQFSFGDTNFDRKSFVKQHITSNNILDIGCGQGAYIFDYANKIGDNVYHAVDIDPECISIVERKMKHREIDNVVLYSTLDDFETDDSMDVLMIEVIEHMSEENACQLLQQVLSTVNFNKIMITTPNRDFNVHYGMSVDDKRHPDHDFEWTFEQFKWNMCHWTENHAVQIHFEKLGDCVNGIYPQSACVISHV